MYQVKENKMQSEGLSEYISYGLTYPDEEGKIICIEDICTEKEKVEYFADQLNRCQISPVQIYEAIDDFLGEQ